MKVVLMGTSGSGKTTLFRSMQTHKERDSLLDYNTSVFKEILSETTQETTLKILKAMESKDLQGVHEWHMHYSNLLCDRSFNGGNAPLRDDISNTITALWKDQGFQKYIEKYTEPEIIDDMDYWVNQLPRVSTPYFIPTLQDVMRMRVRTTGIHKSSFQALNTPLTVYDVGGAPSELRKWRFLFPNMELLLFTVDISAYDQPPNDVFYHISKSRQTNQLAEQLKLFEKVINVLDWDPGTPVIFVITKSKYLESKLTRTPAQLFFPTYEGGNSADQFLEYIIDRLKTLSTNRAKVMDVCVMSLSERLGLPGEVVLDSIKGVLRTDQQQSGSTGVKDGIQSRRKGPFGRLLPFAFCM